MKCSRIIECKSSAGWARGCAPINIWVFTLHSFIAWDTEQSQLRARDTRGIKWRSSTERALASECLVTTWCNLQPVSVSRYQECVTEACVPDGNGYSSAVCNQGWFGHQPLQLQNEISANLYLCVTDDHAQWPPIRGVSCHNSDCHPVIMGAVR